uniref:Uncharacterized protein n=1 Tax=Oryza rufipogon TaxID=4529 RepID=A0A0E0MRP1_ORYRU
MAGDEVDAPKALLPPRPAILVASAGQHLPRSKGKWYAPPSYGRSRRARPVRCPDAARRPSSRTPPEPEPPVGLVDLSPFACLRFTSSTPHPTSIPTTTPPAVHTPRSPIPMRSTATCNSPERKRDRLELQGGDLEVRASLSDHPVIVDALQERVNPAAPLLASAALLLPGDLI